MDLYKYSSNLEWRHCDMKVSCSMCQKEYELTAKDPQYLKLKRGDTKIYTCKKCNDNLKNEAQQSTGFNPNLVDPDKHDKFIP